MRFLLKAAVAALMCVSGASLAAGTVELLTPADGAIIPVPEFPATVPVTLEFSFTNPADNACINNAVNSLKVTATLLPNGTPITIYNANPNLGNTCPSPLGFDWSVASAGMYALAVTAKQGNTTDTDQIEVTISLETVVSVEYPAPPAIANAYINSVPDLKKLQAKRRGCIISKIATWHGQEERYNPKPGPYNEGLIKSDVDSLLGC